MGSVTVNVILCPFGEVLENVETVVATNICGILDTPTLDSVRPMVIFEHLQLVRVRNTGKQRSSKHAFTYALSPETKLRTPFPHFVCS